MFYQLDSHFLQSHQPNLCTLRKPLVWYINPRSVISPTLLPNTGNLNYKVHRWTHAHLMTIEETSVWIWTFGHQRRWVTAKHYAQAFKHHKIDGEKLKYLTHEWLKGIIFDNIHRQTILDEINRLFPLRCSSEKSVRSSVHEMEEISSESFAELESSSSTNISSPSTESSVSCSEGMEISSNSSVSSQFMKYSPRMSSLSSQSVQSSLNFSMKSSPSSESMESLENSSDRSSISSEGMNYVKLDSGNIATSLRTNLVKLWPNTDESKLNDDQQIKLLYSKFERFGFKVKITPPEDDDYFKVKFADVKSAQQALNEAKEIGYRLEA